MQAENLLVTEGAPRKQKCLLSACGQASWVSLGALVQILSVCAAACGFLGWSRLQFVQCPSCVLAEPCPAPFTVLRSNRNSWTPPDWGTCTACHRAGVLSHWNTFVSMALVINGNNNTSIKSHFSGMSDLDFPWLTWGIWVWVKAEEQEQRCIFSPQSCSSPFSGNHSHVRTLVFLRYCKVLKILQVGNVILKLKYEMCETWL